MHVQMCKRKVSRDFRLIILKKKSKLLLVLCKGATITWAIWKQCVKTGFSKIWWNRQNVPYKPVPLSEMVSMRFYHLSLFFRWWSPSSLFFLTFILHNWTVSCTLYNTSLCTEVWKKKVQVWSLCVHCKEEENICLILLFKCNTHQKSVFALRRLSKHTLSKQSLYFD